MATNMNDPAGQKDGGRGGPFRTSCEVVDALPRTPLHRGRVIAAATIATHALERRRMRKAEGGRTVGLTETLHDIDTLSRIAMILMLAERTRSKTIVLTREDFKIIERPWTMLTGVGASSLEPKNA